MRNRLVAGPSSTSPSGLNREPWSGQSHDFSASFHLSVPPRWVQSATTPHRRPSTFETPPGSSYPPILEPHLIDHARPVTVEGEGGPLAFEPLPQVHGDIVSLGFRIGALAYCPDVSDFPQETAARLHGLDVLVIDALQYKTHPSHFSLAEALDWIGKLAPKKSVLTHMHVPLDYAVVLAETPSNVEPAYDGMTIEIPYESK